ncbi:MAG: MmgE/PrpD family protein [Lachnospiraceae bacterium]|nr:MmgE/PrpD family protein [Lachnospiraceae bacterium]
MSNVAKDFVKEIDQVFNNDLPLRVKSRAKYAFLDYICVTLAGAEYNRSKLEKYLALSDGEEARYCIIGIESKASLKDAVFLNGLSAHSLDYDDGTNAGIIHLGSPIFSVLLGIAEKYDIGLDRFYRAVVAGYEASFSMAYAMQPIHKKKGYHATGTCGIIGATLAICYALNYTEKEKFNAFSTACISASGMLKVLDESSELKPYNVAKTALMALVSAQMAKAGFEGPEDPLGGARGYFAMMTGNKDLIPTKPCLDSISAIERAYIKPYAACRYCHPSIECSIKIRQQLLEKEEIRSINRIEVRTYSLAINGHDHIHITNASSAKMSIPYSVCVALLFGKAGLGEYSDKLIDNTEINELIKKVEVIADDEMDAHFPEKQIASVRVLTRNEIYEESVEYPKGEMQNPFSEDEFEHRFFEMCRYAGKSEEVIALLYDAVLAENKSVKEIVSIL